MGGCLIESNVDENRHWKIDRVIVDFGTVDFVVVGDFGTVEGRLGEGGMISGRIVDVVGSIVAGEAVCIVGVGVGVGVQTKWKFAGGCNMAWIAEGYY